MRTTHLTLAALLVAVAGYSVEAATSTQAALLDEMSYNAELNRRHFDLTRDQLILLGEQEYERIQAEMTTLARQIDPTKSWQTILRTFERTSHPASLTDVIPAYERELRRARAFVMDRQLVSLPAASDLSVKPTPANLKVAYAIYMYTSDVLFVRLVTEPGDETEALETHNDGLIALAATHEGYPGHRTQNLVRPIGGAKDDAETTIEGWGLYAEELMLRAGYYDTRPAPVKLFALRMLLHRAARAFLDPKIHRRDLTPEQALRFLTNEVGLSDARARIEVTGRFVGAPSSAATYLVGKRQIEQLRRQVKAVEGNRFTMKSFHDRLLSAGTLPIQTIARQVFRTELDSSGMFRVDPSTTVETGEPWSARLRGQWLMVGVAFVVLTLVIKRIVPRGWRKAVGAAGSSGSEP